MYEATITYENGDVEKLSPLDSATVYREVLDFVASTVKPSEGVTIEITIIDPTP